MSHLPNMPTSKIPDHYIKREDAEQAIGKSPKTIYRRIKKAIETEDSDLKVLLDHCKLELIDGEVINGRQVTSMEEIDHYRQEGRVPTWHIDPEELARYFQTTESPKAREGSRHAANEIVASTGGEKSPGLLDPRIIEQYEERIKEKDERISELNRDKDHLRGELAAFTELTNKITGLLGHSQLKALGLPTTESQRRDSAVSDAEVIARSNEEPTERNVVARVKRQPLPAKPKTSRKPQPRKPSLAKPKWYEMPTISRLFFR